MPTRFLSARLGELREDKSLCGCTDCLKNRGYGMVFGVQRMVVRVQIVVGRWFLEVTLMMAVGPA